MNPNPKGNNIHNWTAFVKSPDIDLGRYIKKVRFGLHPSFGISYRDEFAAPGRNSF